ncbi:MAG: EscU/YscU/HrcU family type III secretion system export apparatus switch protein [Acetobacterales bacterium]
MSDDRQDSNRRDSEGRRPKRQKPPVAVALRYEGEGETAPKVTASGRGTVAEQILALAFANGVKVREDADLAELLAAIDIDSEIPVEAFAAVAEVLAYVYRVNARPAPHEESAR